MNVTEWLLNADPSIRWQVMRDLTGEPADTVAAERSRVAAEGWGARLLRLQDATGHWAGREYEDVPDWTSTYFSLQVLQHLGLDPASEQARAAVARIREHVGGGSTGTTGPTFRAKWSPASTAASWRRLPPSGSWTRATVAC